MKVEISLVDETCELAKARVFSSTFEADSPLQIVHVYIRKDAVTKQCRGLATAWKHGLPHTHNNPMQPWLASHQQNSLSCKCNVNATIRKLVAMV